MKEKKEMTSDLEQKIKDDLQKEADEIRRTVQSSVEEELTEEQKEEIRENLREKIETYEKEKVYAQLSEEDREALEIGKRVQKEQREGLDKSGRRKPGRRRRVYVSLAAVLILVLAMGITSVGGPKRIVEIVRTMVGEREVVKVNSNEDNLRISEESEEKAYQAVKEAFGIEPVRIADRPKKLKFDSVEVDENIQTAELLYKYGKNNFIYFMKTSYIDISWSMDVDDTLSDLYYKQKRGNQIEIKEYTVAGQESKKYMASYTYKGMEYYLIGIMNKKDFERIIDNLHFF